LNKWKLLNSAERREWTRRDQALTIAAQEYFCDPSKYAHEPKGWQLAQC
jgi:hypothetical protein